jgi:GTP-binding protein EngB required for normal cell division
MIKHAIIVLGPSGVGKSSIVNLLTKENKCRVSNKMLTDGTFVNDIKAIQFPAIENSFIIDTPGLGSCNVEREFMGKLREILLKEQISTVSFLLMLFDDQRVPKAGVDAINYMKFVADITDDPSFGLLVRKKDNTLGAPSNPENRADFAMRFPNVKFFDLPSDVPL